MPGLNKWLLPILIGAIVLFLVYSGVSMPRLDGKTSRVVINEAVVDQADPHVIVEPMWWSVSIYDGPAIYHRDLQKFSQPQRYLLAILWYEAEVNNGGHHQFYLNSTGIVWKDALRGFQEIGANEHAHILQESANKLGGLPSLDHDARQFQLRKLDLDAFEELDNRFYEKPFHNYLVKYIKANRADFYFDGVVNKP